MSNREGVKTPPTNLNTMAHKIFNYNGQDVYLETDTYAKNGALAVCMCTPDGELYDVITTNLGHRLQSSSMAFLDVNNHPDICKWMENNGLAAPMYLSIKSGFVSYPLYTIFTKRFEE